MDILITRLNQNLRNQQPKSGYSTVGEYNKIYEYPTIDGFREAMNYLSESGAGNYGDPPFQKVK